MTAKSERFKQLLTHQIEWPILQQEFEAIAFQSGYKSIRGAKQSFFRLGYTEDDVVHITDGNDDAVRTWITRPDRKITFEEFIRIKRLEKQGVPRIFIAEQVMVNLRTVFLVLDGKKYMNFFKKLH